MRSSLEKADPLAVVVRYSLALSSVGRGLWVVTNGTHISSIGLYGNERGILLQSTRGVPPVPHAFPYASPL
jgi:hypothetical protein